MRTLHRTIAGSAFGAMAAATVAASAAYACHPKASVVFSTYNPMPGEHVRVWGNGFDAYHTVHIWLGTKSDSLRHLGSTAAQAVDSSGRPQVDLVVPIPPDAPWGTYLLGATQEGSENPGLFRATVTVGPRSSESGGYFRAKGEPTGPPPPSAPVVTGDVSVGGGRASGPSSVVVSAPAPAPAAASASLATPAGATSSANRPGADPAAQQQVVDPRSEAPAAAPAPFESTAAPQVASLWSGLDPALVPALLDAPAPPPEKGAAALGMVLLGFGAATLAGTGLSIGRRRLALATRR